MRIPLADPPAPIDIDSSIDFLEWVKAAAQTDTPPRPPRSGASLMLLQPHPDDAALSAGGLVGSVRRPIAVITTHSASRDSSTTVRRGEEDKTWARLNGVDASALPFAESSTKERASWQPDIAVAQELQVIKDPFDVIAPAGVGRHPDHAQLHRIAFAMGVGAFWEDLAFWGIYGLSSCDRRLVALAPDARWVLVTLDIGGSLHDKVLGLACYPSQSLELWRPVRHAWTAAREVSAPFHFGERYFLRDLDTAHRWISAINYRVDKYSETTYGGRHMSVICAGPQ